MVVSYRHTFITEFIYSGAEEHQEANKKLADVFKQWCHRTLDKGIDERGLGYFAGIIGTGSPEFADLPTFVYELEKVTPVPFRLTVMQESGPVVTYNVEPRS